MDRYGDAFGIRDQAHELRVTASAPASGGRSSVRFQQLQDGVAVLGGEIVVNLDNSGDILSVNGEALPPNTLATTPRIDAAQAADAALAAIARQNAVSQAALSASTPTLWIYDSRLLGGPGLARPQLVWRTEVTAQAPRRISELVLVDARLGTIALHFDQLESVGLDRRVCDANESTDQVPCTAPVRVERGPASAIADANDAYDFSGDTYNFYAALGRDSIDDSGLTLLSTVRACTTTDPCPLQNA